MVSDRGTYRYEDHRADNVVSIRGREILDVVDTVAYRTVDTEIDLASDSTHSRFCRRPAFNRYASHGHDHVVRRR